MKLIELRYSVVTVRRAVWHYWWRSIGVRYLLAILLIAASFSYGVAHGDRSWLLGALGAVLALAISFAAALYLVHIRAAVKRFDRLENACASIGLTDTRVRLESKAGSSEVGWEMVREVWRFPTIWLLVFSPAHFVTLPLADLDPEAQEMILTNVRRRGGKIQ
jgi:hypothetical protein